MREFNVLQVEVNYDKDRDLARDSRELKEDYPYVNLKGVNFPEKEVEEHLRTITPAKAKSSYEFLPTTPYNTDTTWNKKDQDSFVRYTLWKMNSPRGSRHGAKTSRTVAKATSDAIKLSKDMASKGYKVNIHVGNLSLFSAENPDYTVDKILLENYIKEAKPNVISVSIGENSQEGNDRLNALLESVARKNRIPVVYAIGNTRKGEGAIPKWGQIAAADARLYSTKTPEGTPRVLEMNSNEISGHRGTSFVAPYFAGMLVHAVANGVERNLSSSSMQKVFYLATAFAGEKMTEEYTGLDRKLKSRDTPIRLLGILQKAVKEGYDRVDEWEKEQKVKAGVNTKHNAYVGGNMELRREK